MDLNYLTASAIGLDNAQYIERHISVVSSVEVVYSHATRSLDDDNLIDIFGNPCDSIV